MKYIIITSLVLIFFNSCIKKECKIAGSFYNFEIPTSLSPARDSFNIDDTITIISTFPDEVYEKITDRKYELINFDFFPITTIYRIDTLGNINNFSEFEVIIDKKYNYNFFNASNGERHLIGVYNYNNNIYDLQYKVIPKEQGLYLLQHGSSIVVLGDEQDFEGKCSNVKSDVYVNMNDGADNNIEMLSDSPDETLNTLVLGKPEKQFHKFGSYVFYVRE